MKRISRRNFLKVAGVGAAAEPCPAGPSAGKRVCGTGQPTDRRAGDLAGYVSGITTRV